MTIAFDVGTLVTLLESLQADDYGFVKTSLFAEKIAELYNCSWLTVHNFIVKNPQIFDYKHGYVRPAPRREMGKQDEDQKVYKAWLAPREVLLNECTTYLASLSPNPFIENLLVAIATAREDLKSYSDYSLSSILLTLKRELNFEPQTKLE